MGFLYSGRNWLRRLLDVGVFAEKIFAGEWWIGDGSGAAWGDDG
jgi:hypothetical protein